MFSLLVLALEWQKNRWSFIFVSVRVHWNINGSVKRDCIDWLYILVVGKKKKDSGCGPTCRLKLSLYMHVFENVSLSAAASVSLHCAWGLMRKLQFTVHTKAFICQSQQKIRRYQRSPMSNFSSCRHPQGGRSASQGWRRRGTDFAHSVLASFESERCFHFYSRVAFEIKDRVLSLMQRPFSLSHLS